MGSPVSAVRGFPHLRRGTLEGTFLSLSCRLGERADAPLPTPSPVCPPPSPGSLSPQVGSGYRVPGSRSSFAR